MNRFRLFLVAALVMLLTVAALMIVWNLMMLRPGIGLPVEVRRFPIEFTVESENILGMTYNSTFALGGVPAGGIARKAFNVTHGFKQPVMVIMGIEGDIKTFSYIQPPRVRLAPGEAVEAVLDVRPTNTTALGRHYGTLIIMLYAEK